MAETVFNMLIRRGKPENRPLSPPPCPSTVPRGGEVADSGVEIVAKITARGMPSWGRYRPSGASVSGWARWSRGAPFWGTTPRLVALAPHPVVADLVGRGERGLAASMFAATGGQVWRASGGVDVVKADPPAARPRHIITASVEAKGSQRKSPMGLSTLRSP